MTGALIILAVTVVTGLILWLTHRPDAPKTEAEEPVAEPAGDECCGLHEVCEKRAMTADEPPVYYEDEYLDAYANRGADSYQDAEIEEFRDVLLTLLPKDVPGWLDSLEKRQIALPESLRDETLLIISELA